jgi:hypothetical protein
MSVTEQLVPVGTGGRTACIGRCPSRSRTVQSSGFILDLEGRVIVSVYSSGAIGRLVPEDVIGLIKYVREHEAKQQAA